MWPHLPYPFSSLFWIPASKMIVCRYLPPISVLELLDILVGAKIAMWSLCYSWHIFPEKEKTQGLTFPSFLHSFSVIGFCVVLSLFFLQRPVWLPENTFPSLSWVWFSVLSVSVHLMSTFCPLRLFKEIRRNMPTGSFLKRRQGEVWCSFLLLGVAHSFFFF